MRDPHAFPPPVGAGEPCADEDLVLVLSTAPDETVASLLARGLVEARVAACVSILPGLVSHYRWEGLVRHESEVQLLIKTTAATLPLLEEALSRLHPYEVPEFLILPAGASAAYGTWVRGEVLP